MTPMPTDTPLPAILDRLDRLTDWEKRPRGGMRVGLDPMRDLLARLGAPHARLRVVHVGGTKGKGSVCALIEAGLMRAGLRVGRYASPHVESVTERVCLQGRPVEEARLAHALARALDAHEAARRDDTAGRDATWFDVLTAAALAIFGEAGLDWAVIEVGLGGRLDSTNAVESEVAVVTNVALEHTEILGGTRAAIAAEKVGILKPGAVLVTTLPADDEAGAVAAARAAALGCPVLRPVVPAGASIEEENAALAGLVLDHLGGTGSRGRDGAPLRAGLLDAEARAGACLPGRLERRRISTAAGVVPVVLDGAHVPFNLAAVLRDLGRAPDLAGPCLALVALAGDKDAAGFLAVLARHGASVVATEMPERRGHPAATLRALAAAEGMEAEAVADPGAALTRAADLAARRGGWLLVTGSLHLVGALRAATGAVARA
ncbi:dihydrofolate synthase / folylpolyglutamate synthase [Methylobacterium sp. 174MFSha1.1]|uniref:bifunctional folylpolyglutamate synthase/dihydrofolate synthase n=1 Tax=Methylobacterium sp. 174MFSha1.1 TaxID=1502749 RepID=UPI0008E2F65C|nr:Mur ligase family protein [Methylobacterium sp. 174MFSha1.1]SFU61193.1 dihydrofolate synthase / folylpolyglutamate synthase [Methylobacterium sp. 174MFSha1.1]